MTQCYPKPIRFSSVKRRKVEADFSGGAISSNGGIQLLAQVDRRLGLTGSVARSLEDSRRQASCDHRLVDLLRQRVYALALGHEDLNDHGELRHDPALQTAAGRLEALASPPRRLILDFDATDTLLHGEQEERFFHAYYDGYCYLPLYVFCGRHLLVSYLRPSGVDAARHAWGILALLVKALRARWPRVKIVFRGDSGFCRWRMLRWCEAHGVGYIVGIARNPRLQRQAEALLECAKRDCQATGRKQRRFGSVWYAARTWDRARRVIVKAEHTARGANPRFVVTNLSPQTDRYLYTRLYCARGDMENRIKNQQMDLFADRASCHRFWSNQFRQLLSGLAYTLMEGLRRLALGNTALAVASPNRIRLTLLRIGAVVLRNTRRIRLLLSSACPHQELFRMVAVRLDTS